jgi:hypothetical protein
MIGWASSTSVRGGNHPVVKKALKAVTIPKESVLEI